MKRLIFLITAFAVISCTENPMNTTEDNGESNTNITPAANEFLAEKAPWQVETRASDDTAFAKDIPWQEGEQVMVICTGLAEKKDEDKGGNNDEGAENGDGAEDSDGAEGGEVVDNRGKIYMCTVSKANGLKCTLTSEVDLEDGLYQAVYPVYDYVFYYDYGLQLHLSFLYEEGLGLDYKHQDIVISEPTTYKKGHKLSFEMKHVCALVDIDIYPPKTGNFSLLKVVADETVFAGKANYNPSDEYSINGIADQWFNFTTLRGDGNSVKEGELFHTSTGLLPVQYDGMPMRIYMKYEDGTYFLSDTFSMPSLNFGVENKLTITNFEQIDGPVQGLWGYYYQDPNAQPHEIDM